MKSIVSAFAAMSAALVSCGGGELSNGEEDQALAPGRSAYVTAARDRRECPAPTCGGWFLSEVNRSQAAVHVPALDFARSGLDEAAIAVALHAGDGELLLRGSLAAAAFEVTEAYRGLPGVVPAAGETIYRLEPGSASAWTAKRLNTGGAESCDSITVDRAARPWVDKSFVAERLLNYSGLVSASVRSAQLVASQVFLRLPLQRDPCPAQRVPACADGQSNVFTRTDDLCVVPDGCATPATCATPAPECDPGYVPTSWPSAPDACPTYRCDPEFAAR
jgi:hypothetical protein